MPIESLLLGCVCGLALKHSKPLGTFRLNAVYLRLCLLLGALNLCRGYLLSLSYSLRSLNHEELFSLLRALHRCPCLDSDELRLHACRI